MVRPHRRQILLAAVVAGAGVGGARLALPSLSPAVRSRTSTVRAAWPPPADPDRARVAQLLRRTTFGYSAAELEAAAADGFARTVDRLIATRAAEPPSLIKPDDPTRGAQLSAEDLQRWWLTHLLSTPARFPERVTYFWHGHFTSEVDKTGGLFMYWQNLTWRRMALGKLGGMLSAVTVDPAMLTYLDLVDSDASDPGRPPNENYARELLELFTMGPGHYQETDVKAAARALAGWTAPPADGQVEAVVDDASGARETFDVWNHQVPGVFDSARAFPGEVGFLGRSGRLDLDAIAERILAHPETAPFIAHKVAVHFVSPSPAAKTVRDLADGFRRSGYDVKDLLRAALLSPEFSDSRSYRSLIRSPVEFIVGAAMALGLPVAATVDLVMGSSEAAGETLFSPPNVAGWPPNRGWISPATLLARLNFVSQLLGGVESVPAARDAVDLHLDGVLGESTRRRLSRATSDNERWLALLASPEFQLK